VVKRKISIAGTRTPYHPARSLACNKKGPQLNTYLHECNCSTTGWRKCADMPKSGYVYFNDIHIFLSEFYAFLHSSLAMIFIYRG